MKRFLPIFLLVVLLISGAARAGETAKPEPEYATRFDALSRVLHGISGLSDADLRAADVSVLDRFSDCVGFAEREEMVSDVDGTLPQFRLNASHVRLLAYGVEHGIIQGFGDGTLRPFDTLSRAEFACILYRSRELYPEREKLLDFACDYADVADWNRTEIVYCIERGLMMGSGTAFDSADPLTKEQLEIVWSRGSGLSTMEKYQFLYINHASPLAMDRVLAGRNDAALTFTLEELEQDYGWKPIGDMANRGGAWEDDMCSFFSRMIGLRGDFDYRDHLDDYDMAFQSFSEKYETIQDNYSGFYHEGLPSGGRMGDSSVDFFAENFAARVVRECFFIVSPANSLKIGYGSLLYDDYNRGYEYFLYHECDPGALPNGVELGIWYRRVVTLKFEARNAMSGFSYDLFVESAPAEPVPPELLINTKPL